MLEKRFTAENAEDAEKNLATDFTDFREERNYELRTKYS